MSTQSLSQYEVYAIKYADSPGRTEFRNFLETRDLHDGPMPMNFYVWVAVSGDRIIMIDSGCEEEICKRKGYRFLCTPVEALGHLGIRPEQVTDLVVSHLHWDHAGNINLFPSARIIVQEAELAHATGVGMSQRILRTPYDVNQVCDMVRALYGGRVRFNKGELEIASGVTAHLVGGHTPGLQVVRINTRRGNIVVASDAVHFYANGTLGNPFPVVVNIQDYLEAFQIVAALAESPQHIIAGHDPIVTDCFPAYEGTGASEVVCLSLQPEKAVPDITESWRMWSH